VDRKRILPAKRKHVVSDGMEQHASSHPQPLCFPAAHEADKSTAVYSQAHHEMVWSLSFLGVALISPAGPLPERADLERKCSRVYATSAEESSMSHGLCLLLFPCPGRVRLIP